MTPDGNVTSNGGVPQAANFTEHEEKLRSGVQGWIPSIDWDGNAAFDFEDWTPVFERNDGSGSWHGDAYYRRSLDLVQRLHPNWTHAQVVAAANQSFTDAGVDFFAATLATVRALRPSARWGFYGFPQNDYFPCDYPAGQPPACGYDSSKGPTLRAQNDRLAAVWGNSTALFPSVYIPPRPGGWSLDTFFQANRKYVRATTQESVRLAREHSSGPVRPFAWSFYHNGTQTLAPQDVQAVLEGAYQPPGADGVIWWGDPAHFGMSQFQAFAKDTLGPAVKAFLQSKCDCAKETCGGHGACLPGAQGGVEGGAPPACACFEGWSGPDCSQPSGPEGGTADGGRESPSKAAPTTAVPAYPAGSKSAVGDPGMRLAPRVLMEGWTFCNRAGGNCSAGPRWADCAPDQGQAAGPGPGGNLVTESANARGLNASSPQAACDPFTQQKERDLGALCERQSTAGGNSSFFWTGMLKSGNMDDDQECKLCGLWCEPDCCPKGGARRSNSRPVPPAGAAGTLRGAQHRLPADGVHGSASRNPRAGPLGFDNDPMNQPVVAQQWTSGQGVDPGAPWTGAIFGSWDTPAGQTRVAVRTLAETGRKVPCREYPSVDPVLCQGSGGSSRRPEANRADGAACDLTGVWVGTDKAHALSVAQVNASVALATAEPWGPAVAILTVTPGTGGRPSRVALQRPGGAPETGTVQAVAGSSGPCTGIQWDQAPTATWCRNSSACAVPSPGPLVQASFFQQDWRVAAVPAPPSEAAEGEVEQRLVYRSTLRTSASYSWLMLYFGADAAQGPKGGYPWDGRGIMNSLPQSSPHFSNETNAAFRARFWLNVTRRQSLGSFYFQNWASCWKQDGRQCDGDLQSDVTRYILMDLNQKAEGRGPAGEPLTCGPAPDEQLLCPAWHDLADGGGRVFPGDTDRFPYDAYHYVGGSGRVGRSPSRATGQSPPWSAGAAYRRAAGVTAASPVGHFDFFSNPQAQDFIKLAPSPEWAAFGLPASIEAAMQPGWWDVDVGGVTAKVPMEGTEPSVRVWTTVNIGPEMGIGGSGQSETAEWEVAGFDVLTQTAGSRAS